jgi:osmoprotectant transport system ATP-binding protein
MEMTMKPKAIDVDNVTCGYGREAPLFDHLSLHLPAGLITVILGKSGSGKSTLLQMLNGLIKPQNGAVRFDGTPIDYTTVDALRHTIGYVVQQVGLFPHLTIGENISILGKVKRWQKEARAARVEELMDMVRLPLHYNKRYPHELSGGEQQRAGICRALFLDPPVLLMDEPFASLDTATRDVISNYLLSIQQHGPRTVVMVSHNWDEAAALADHFVLLEKGSVRAAGEKSALMEIKQHYLREK